MSDKKLVTINQRREIAQLLEDDQAFLDFVINETTNDSWLGDETCQEMMKLLSAESEQEFFAGLCHMGFEIYTDYLFEKHQDYLNSAHGSMLH